MSNHTPPPRPQPRKVSAAVEMFEAKSRAASPTSSVSTTPSIPSIPHIRMRRKESGDSVGSRSGAASPIGVRVRRRESGPGIMVHGMQRKESADSAISIASSSGHTSRTPSSYRPVLAPRRTSAPHVPSMPSSSGQSESPGARPSGIPSPTPTARRIPRPNGSQIILGAIPPLGSRSASASTIPGSIGSSSQSRKGSVSMGQGDHAEAGPSRIPRPTNRRAVSSGSGTGSNPRSGIASSIASTSTATPTPTTATPAPPIPTLASARRDTSGSATTTTPPHSSHSHSNDSLSRSTSPSQLSSARSRPGSSRTSYRLSTASFDSAHGYVQASAQAQGSGLTSDQERRARRTSASSLASIGREPGGPRAPTRPASGHSRGKASIESLGAVIAGTGGIGRAETSSGVRGIQGEGVGSDMGQSRHDPEVPTSPNSTSIAIQTLMPNPIPPRTSSAPNSPPQAYSPTIRPRASSRTSASGPAEDAVPVPAPPPAVLPPPPRPAISSLRRASRADETARPTDLTVQDQRQGSGLGLGQGHSDFMPRSLAPDEGFKVQRRRASYNPVDGDVGSGEGGSARDNNDGREARDGKDGKMAVASTPTSPSFRYPAPGPFSSSPGLGTPSGRLDRRHNLTIDTSPPNVPLPRRAISSSTSTSASASAFASASASASALGTYPDSLPPSPSPRANAPTHGRSLSSALSTSSTLSASTSQAHPSPPVPPRNPLRKVSRPPSSLGSWTLDSMDSRRPSLGGMPLESPAELPEPGVGMNGNGDGEGIGNGNGSIRVWDGQYSNTDDENENEDGNDPDRGLGARGEGNRGFTYSSYSQESIPSIPSLSTPNRLAFAETDADAGMGGASASAGTSASARSSVVVAAEDGPNQDANAQGDGESERPLESPRGSIEMSKRASGEYSWGRKRQGRILDPRDLDLTGVSPEKRTALHALTRLNANTPDTPDTPDSSMTNTESTGNTQHSHSPPVTPSKDRPRHNQGQGRDALYADGAVRTPSKSPSMPLLGHGSPPSTIKRPSHAAAPQRSGTDPMAVAKLLPPPMMRSPTTPNIRSAAATPASGSSKRVHLIREIASSERAYANDLALIRDVFIGRGAANTGTGLGGAGAGAGVRPNSTHSTADSNSAHSPAVESGSARSSMYTYQTAETRRTSLHSNHASTPYLGTMPTPPLPKSPGDMGTGGYFGKTLTPVPSPRPGSMAGASASGSGGGSSGGGAGSMPPPVGKPLSPADIRAVFLNIDQLAIAAEDLASDFERAIGEEESGPGIVPREGEGGTDRLGEVFASHVPRLRALFTIYCARQSSASVRLRELQSDAAHATFLADRWGKIKDYTHAWNLDSMLIKPVQRITKYPLLFEDLLGCTTPVHLDYFSIRSAAELARSVAVEIDEAKRRKDVVAGVIRKGDRDASGGLQGGGTSGNRPPPLSVTSGQGKTPKRGLKLFRSQKERAAGGGGGMGSSGSLLSLNQSGSSSTLFSPPLSSLTSSSSNPLLPSPSASTAHSHSLTSTNSTPTLSSAALDIPALISKSSISEYKDLCLRMDEAEQVIKRLGKEVVVWTAAVREFWTAQDGLARTWGYVVRLEDRDPVDKRLGAFREALSDVGVNVWGGLNAEIRDSIMPVFSSLLESFTNPRKVISRRNSKEGDYARFLALKERQRLSVGERPLLESVRDFTALHAQLVEELPLFLEGFSRILDFAMVALAKAQSRYHAQVRDRLHRFSVNWIAPPPPSPGRGSGNAPPVAPDPATGRGIVKAWHDAWAPYSEAMDHLNITLPARNAAERAAQLASRNNARHSQSLANLAIGSGGGGGGAASGDLVKRFERDRPNSSGASTKPGFRMLRTSSSRTDSVPGNANTVNNAPPVSPKNASLRPIPVQRRSADRMSFGLPRLSPAEERVFEGLGFTPTSRPASMLSRGPSFRSAASALGTSSNAQSVEDDGDVTVKYGLERVTSGEEVVPAAAAAAGGSMSALQRISTSPSVNGEGAERKTEGVVDLNTPSAEIPQVVSFPPTPPVIGHSNGDIPTPPGVEDVFTHSPTDVDRRAASRDRTSYRKSRPSTQVQDDDAGEGWRGEKVLYQCVAVADFDPSRFGAKRYRKLRFLPVVTGEMIDVYYEVGRIDELPAFPYPEIGVDNDGVLVGRTENGDIGLLICSFLEPLAAE